MSIDFSPERWANVRENARRWWAGELDRPLVCLTVGGRTPDRPAPALPQYGFTAHYDASVPAEAIIDVWDYRLSCQTWVADGFPCAWPNFGPGVGAAFLGAEAQPAPNTVWFADPEPRPLAELAFPDEPAHPWFQRIVDLYRAGLERWDGQVLLGMTDLGGSLDILQPFRPGEALLYDLYDHPEDVVARLWDVHERWFDWYDRLTEVLGPTNPGCSGWPTFYAERSFYMLQCDFAYMLGPEMFARFVLPELAASCRRLEHAFYHLDGPGQLPHLDLLLGIPELKGIQWIPGDGQPDVTCWPEVYRRIREAGKLIQVFSGQSSRGLEILDVLADQLGTTAGIVLVGWCTEADLDQALPVLARHGVDG